MDIETILKTYLVNLEVSYCRLAGNSLIIYLNCQLEEETGFVVWLEPTWHFASHLEVLIGSRQAQVETKEELEEVFKPIKQLYGKKIKDINIDLTTKDINIEFEHFYIRTFVADPSDDHIWHIIDKESHRRINASPKGIVIMKE